MDQGRACGAPGRAAGVASDRANRAGPLDPHRADLGRLRTIDSNRVTVANLRPVHLNLGGLELRLTISERVVAVASVYLSVFVLRNLTGD
jgi:hypothetical protein